MEDSKGVRKFQVIFAACNNAHLHFIKTRVKSMKMLYAEGKPKGLVYSTNVIR